MLFGSFNPVHNGHLGIAQKALGEVDEVWFVVHPTNPFKQLVLTPIATRLEILALIDHKTVVGQPTMRQSLELLTHDHPEHSFVLLMGDDLATILPAWDDYKYLKNYPVIAYERQTPVSSSLVRAQAHKGEPIRDLVPPQVHDHILSAYGS